MSSLPLINSTQLNTITARPRPVLLDFWQPSCAPCLALEPILEQFSAAHPGLFEGYRIDIDTQHDLVERNHVTSIPTIPDEGVRVRVPCFDLGGRRRALTPERGRGFRWVRLRRS